MHAAQNPLQTSAGDFVAVAAVGVRISRIKGSRFLFVPEHQQLFKIDAATERLWPALRTGALVRDIAEMAADFGQDGIGLVEQLRKIGAVRYVSLDDAPALVETRVTVSVGGACIGINFTGPRAMKRLRGVFAHLETPVLPVEEIVVFENDEGIGLALSGDEPVSYGWTEAGPALKLLLTELALEATEGVALHVGTLRRGKEALLLVGAPGAGKSTLSVALGKRGYELEGDDLAALLPDGRVRAIALPVTLKEGAWPMLAHLHPELRDGEIFVRPDDKTVQYLPLPPSANPPPLRARCALTLCRNESAAPGLEPLGAEQFIAAMIEGAWSSDLRLSPEDFDGLAACADGVEFFRLTYSDLQTGLSLVEEAWQIAGMTR